MLEHEISHGEHVSIKSSMLEDVLKKRDLCLINRNIAYLRSGLQECRYRYYDDNRRFYPVDVDDTLFAMLDFAIVSLYADLVDLGEKDTAQQIVETSQNVDYEETEKNLINYP